MSQRRRGLVEQIDLLTASGAELVYLDPPARG